MCTAIAGGDGTNTDPCVVVITLDAALAEPIATALASRFRVVHVPELEEAVAKARAAEPDLVILDLAPPEAEALILCAELKTVTNAPLLLCSTTPHHWARVGLRLGADDFVCKPLDIDDLEARVVQMLSWARAKAPDTRGRTPTFQVEDLTLVPTRHRATVGGTPLRLTPTEYRLLLALASRPGTTLAREDLVKLVWRTPPETGGRLLDSHVRRLRKKLAASRAVIKTVPGGGIQLSPSGAE
jgi:DNA-binding response OmpR family regulator